MAVHVFALGVNSYREPITSLKCCERDARAVAALFKEGFGYEVEYLEERKAEDILARIKELKPRPGDTFVFYFSGHGKAHKSDQFLLLPHADLELLEGDNVAVMGALSYNMLKRVTSRENWAGVHRLFILDACRSPLLSGKAGSLAVCDSEYLLRDMLLSKRASSAKDGSFSVVNSCDLGATAAEIPSKGHGLFTAALLDQLRLSKDQSRPIRIDADLCQLLEQSMAAQALLSRLPRSLQHKPVFGGEPVELSPRLLPGEVDESTEWEMCVAIGRVERIEVFLRRFPRTVHRQAALDLMRRLSPPSLPRKRPPPLARPPAPAVAPVSAPSRSPESEAGHIRDNRLWQLACGLNTKLSYEKYLLEASSSAGHRQEARQRLLKLSSPAQSSQRRPAPARSEEARSDVNRSQPAPAPPHWQPEPEPEYKLSLDRMADLFRKRKP